MIWTTAVVSPHSRAVGVLDVRQRYFRSTTRVHANSRHDALYVCGMHPFYEVREDRIGQLPMVDMQPATKNRHKNYSHIWYHVLPSKKARGCRALRWPIRTQRDIQQYGSVIHQVVSYFDNRCSFLCDPPFDIRQARNTGGGGAGRQACERQTKPSQTQRKRGSISYCTSPQR